MIAPSLLRNRAYTSGLLVGLTFFAGFAGLVMVTSLFFQLGLHFSPEHAGLTLVPLSVGTAITAGASYALMPRFGRAVLQGGAPGRRRRAGRAGVDRHALGHRRRRAGRWPRPAVVGSGWGSSSARCST